MDQASRSSSGPTPAAADENSGIGWHWYGGHQVALGELQIRETKVSFLLNNCNNFLDRQLS